MKAGAALVLFLVAARSSSSFNVWAGSPEAVESVRTNRKAICYWEQSSSSLTVARGRTFVGVIFQLAVAMAP
jgi:hypothetical protein